MTIAALSWPAASLYIALIVSVALVVAVDLVDPPNWTDRDHER
jgi:hypothetical protein